MHNMLGIALYVALALSPVSLEGEARLSRSIEHMVRSLAPHKKPQSKIFLPILMYHYVEEVKDKNDKGRISLSIHPRIFEKTLVELKDHGYESYFVRDIPDIFSGGLRMGKKNIILTFDDGYEDFYREVYPLLKKYHMRGTLYVINHRVGTPGYVRKEQLREMLTSGLVEVGGHTLDHVHLESVGEKIAREQIVESKLGLEKDLGMKMESFAYPYGGYKKGETDNLVKEAGYRVAVTVERGKNHTPQEIYLLTRIRAGVLIPGKVDSILEYGRREE